MLATENQTALQVPKPFWKTKRFWGFFIAVSAQIVYHRDIIAMTDVSAQAIVDDILVWMSVGGTALGFVGGIFAKGRMFFR